MATERGMEWEYYYFQKGDVDTLGFLRLFLGWPFILVLLLTTYQYGLWRLKKLRGPNIEEFKAGKQSPWKGQQRGF